MPLDLKGHEKRKQTAKDFWLRVATDLNGGLSPADIAKRYKNPLTGKPYTREHIYWVIRRLKNNPVND